MSSAPGTSATASTPSAAPEGVAAPPAGAAPPKARVALWDNARFILIVLVVAGHAISTVRTETAFGFATYAIIYLFHMPAMIALSGLFAKPEATPKAARSTVQLLVTWLLWEAIWALLHFVVDGRGLPETWLVAPAWTLWFLVTLATMRIVLPYIARLRHPLIFSVAVALVAGLSPAIGTQFSASRTLCFLPFFVAAWLGVDRGWFRGDWFMRPARAVRVSAWALLAVIAAVFAALPGLREIWRIDTWLTWRDDYAWLFARAPIAGWAPTEWWTVALAGSGVRLALLGIAAAMTFAVLLIVPRGHSIITVWGARTLYVYLLHGPIVWVLRGSGAAEWIGSFGVPGAVALIAFGVALAAVLSMAWVSRLFRPVIEPRLEWLFPREVAR
ncbi:acyltransferase family protein [Leucobacter sp. W1478]|uniref:acyltransferase family protein n=1 Tax=Leucobacter sp. W1478 TaxID=3439065 RepID=UPI003F37E2A4